MRRLVLAAMILTLLLAFAAPAAAIHSGCGEEAEPRTDHASSGCDQMPPPPVDPPGRT